MKFFINSVLLTLVFFSSSLKAQHSSTIKTAAMDMGNALAQKNSKKFISYMHPVMIELAGGEEQLRMISDSALTVFEQLGGKVSKISFGNPGEVVNHKKILQSVIPQTMTLTSFIADIELSTSLIAISEDEGKSWRFIDTNLFNINQIRSSMPEISPSLVIPKSTQPKVTMKR
jgi:hypothetical protein